jgi:high affinity Mn2+ porin
MVFKSNSQAVEYTHRYAHHSREGAIRLLAFLTTTTMGKYQQSIDLSPVNPSIEATRKNGRTKYGFTVNVEQELTSTLGCFARAGWNDGINETWAFTEIDNSISGGLSMNGKQWKRDNDHIGLAFVSSGLSKPHQDYIAAGGKGFILGDGKLNYTRENLVEFYYSTELKPNSLYLSGGYQLLMNPGFNMDRKGPVNIFSLRLHASI